MKTQGKKYLIAAFLLVAFVLWTVAVCWVDVKPIGPQGSSVGFAALNGYVHDLTGTNMLLYTLTDWLGLIPLAIVMGFGLMGLFQWIRRKHLLKVDHSILALGVFYVLVMAAFLLFEKLDINYRPVLIEGVLEASYPSSTTMLAMCVMPTAMMQCARRIQKPGIRGLVCGLMGAFLVFMVVGRLLSGVHWLTDIIGGALLSGGLVMAYYAGIQKVK